MSWHLKDTQEFMPSCGWWINKSGFQVEETARAKGPFEKLVNVRVRGR